MCWCTNCGKCEKITQPFCGDLPDWKRTETGTWTEEEEPGEEENDDELGLSSSPPPPSPPPFPNAPPHHRSAPDLTGSSSAQYSAEKGTSRASVAAEPVQAALTAAGTPGAEACGSAAGRRRNVALKVDDEEEGGEGAEEWAAFPAVAEAEAAFHSGGACALVLASSSGEVASTATALAAPPASAGATASDASALAIL